MTIELDCRVACAVRHVYEPSACIRGGSLVSYQFDMRIPAGGMKQLHMPTITLSPLKMALLPVVSKTGATTESLNVVILPSLFRFVRVRASQSAYLPNKWLNSGSAADLVSS
jgi:hypothetical protein